MPEIGKEQIDIWKKKYIDVFEIEVEGKKAYLRKPDRKDISHATIEAMELGVFNHIQYSETIMRDCWLGGDLEIIENDDLFLTTLPILQEISEVGKATIKKL